MTGSDAAEGRPFSRDLRAVVVLVGLAWVATLAPVVRTSPVRVAVGLAFLFFGPGYALVAALFPEAGRRSEDDTGAGAVGWAERLVLSFGTSVLVTSVLGASLSLTPWGFQLAPVLLVTSGWTLLFAVVAVRRRARLTGDQRVAVPSTAWPEAILTTVVDGDEPGDRVLDLVVVVGVLIAVGSVSWTIAVEPDPGSGSVDSTELYLLTEAENGRLSAASYPTEFVTGEPRSLVVAVSHGGDAPATYTLVVVLQRTEPGEDGSDVVHQERLRTVDVRLSANETWHHRHTVSPTMIGRRLRLAYLLFESPVPAEPTVDDAYRATVLHVDVSAGENATATSSPTGSA